MMRMMRKMFKRIVSIVMALLVILGTAVYGGSVFAEGAPQEQADSASVTFSEYYIYLDPTGMNSNPNADWTKPSSDPNKPNVYLGYIPSGQNTTTFSGGKYNDTLQCWQWELSTLNITSGTKIFFTYTTDWNGYIDKYDYYRTEDFTLTGDKSTIGGNIYSQNGDSSKSYKAKAYALKTLQSNAGSKLTFVDMTGDMSGVKAQFSYSESFSNNEELKEVGLANNGTVTVPADNGKNMYRYMRFVNGEDKQLTDPIKIEDALDKGGILYYGTVSNKNDGSINSVWSKDKKNSSVPTIIKLYFDRTKFPTDQKDSIQVKIGNGDYQNVNEDPEDSTILSYDHNGKTLSSDTIIEVRKDKITYRFYPNGNRSFVTIDGDGNAGLSIYRKNSSGPYIVYFDATLSELSYEGDVEDKSLPKKDESVWCFAWNESENKSQAIKLIKDDSSEKGSVYKAELDEMYPNIMFYSSANENGALTIDGMKNLPGDSACTYNLTIPWSTMNNPCFYADSSDDCIYNKTKRSGYWDEVGTVRNAEGKTKDGDGVKTDKAIVNVEEGKYTRDNDKLYVNTTLYDYYSDYELNGYNRDNYQNVSINTDRIYQPFRQLDQALSAYYSSYKATNPLYTGNFQNYNDKDTHFSNIAGPLNLFGYDSKDSNKRNKFYYENNSMWGIDGNGLGDSRNATQGLVAKQLKDNHLQISTEGGTTVLSPYFNEDFLNGNNSKNAVLGKVYNDVSFPFIKKSEESSTDKQYEAEYWVFDSANQDAANKNLQLKRVASTGKYFLQSTGEEVYGQTANQGNPKTDIANYFPLNTSSQSGKAWQLNYGFGQKFDLKFKLTDDGTVVGKNPNNQVDTKDIPIEFNFSGDDDVWVFIDGQLVLDVGGDHGVVSGTIDFKDKKATVYGVKNSTGSGRADSNVYNFSEILPDADNTKEHTLTMFYMERGLWESNMSISFNFPDENQFQVEKYVDTKDVNKDIFSDTLFDNASVFPFTIQNQATHFGIKKATGEGTVKPAVFNDTFDSSKIQSVYENTFEKCPEKEGQSDVVHWWAADNDEGRSYIDRRWGIISPMNGEPFNATYNVGTTIQSYKYLQFKFYYDDTHNPSIKYMYIGLEDNECRKTGKYLTQDIVTINNSLSNKKWITVNVDVSQLVKGSDINLSKLKYIKFNYDYSRDFYLDDFKFIPSAEVTEPTGFVTKQHEIADYGSVKSGTLMYPENAVYTISSDKSSTTNIMGDDGKFVLANGETATFSDQFRRGSYIALSEDVDTEVFETSWTMYENGEPVTTNKGGDKVDLTSATTNLTNQPGSTIKDGRKEKYKRGSKDGQQIDNDGLTISGDEKTVGYPGVHSVEGSSAWAKKNGDVSTEDANTIVFRSYSDPDNSTIATKLKVKYTNKVKTGTITIQKKKADVSDDLNGKYTFKVKFFNVAGMNLEGTKPIERTFDIDKKDANGEFEPIVIKGIPAGTQYTISEISADDGAVLESVDTSSGDSLVERYKPKVIYDDTTKLTVVSGAVKADAAEQTKFIFTNKLKPVINIGLTKKWENVSGVTIPDSINIQLQRRVNDSEEWETVKYATPGQTEADYRTLKKDTYNPNKTEWTCSFTGLDRYANGDDGRVDKNKPYKYRIVEVTVADGKVEKVIENSEYLNDLFKVTYTDAISAPSEETESSITKKYTITNTYSPLTNIKITKVDATDTSKMLNGVEFKLEKLSLDNTSTGGDSFKVDSSFKAKFATTGETTDGVGKAQGIAEFKDLKDGTYRLTETKAKAGYSLLKDPIIIKIDRTGATIVRNEGESYDASKHNYIFGTNNETKNTISLQISNRMKFLLPKTGGYGAMLFILCGMALATLCCLIFFLINLRKEVQYSRHKRQRRNAIGK